MTQEGGRPSPDEASTITPPASTRWSEEPVEDDTALAPPYVPGRPDRVEGPAVESLSAETAAAVEPDTATEDPFPFEQATEEPEGEVRAEESPPLEPEAEPPLEDREAWTDHGIQVDEPVGAGETEVDETEPAETEPAEAEPPLEDREAWTDRGIQVEEAAGAGETEREETEPEEAEWREGGVPAELLEAEPTEPERQQAAEEAPWGPPLDHAPDEPVAAATRREEPREEIAGLLERLASAIRAEGAEGIRDDIDSPDRLTSLLAGLLSGHLSARS